MSGVLTTIEEVRQLIILKHMAGQHDQGKHTPKKYGAVSRNASADKVYWVSGDGDILDAGEDHIMYLSEHPEKFGLSVDDGNVLRAAYDDGSYKDAYTTDVITKQALRNGSIRVRESKFGSVNIETDRVDGRTYKRLRNIVTDGGIDIDVKAMYYWSGASDDQHVSFTGMDFVSSQNVRDLR